MPTIVDLYLYGVANDMGKRVDGLESWEDQVDYVAEVHENANDFFDGSAYNQRLLEQVKTSYIQGDIQQIFSLINEMDDPKERNKMLQRNTVMTARITAIGVQSPVFAAVGVAHLAGEYGLINQLRMRGFSVEPVTNGTPLPAGQYAFSRPPSWSPYTDPDGHFHTAMPGTVRSFPVHEMGYRFHGTVDLAQLRFYFVGSMPLVGVQPKQKDSLLRVFSRSMVSKGSYKVLRDSELRDSSGVYGRDLLFLDTDNRVRFRFQVFLLHSRVYLLGLVAPEERMLDDMVSARFLQSFQPLAVAGDSTMRATQWSTGDPATALFYIVVRTDANPGFVISNDSAYFADVASGFGENTQSTLYGLRDTLVQGYPARRFFARAQQEEFFVEALLVKQGCHSSDPQQADSQPGRPGPGLSTRRSP